tara:strand:- start:28 stop:312 length:285 start_codon:yes stop_codon:yes gene_type:complete
MTESEEMQRGAQARAITTDPLFIESLAKLKSEVIDKWAACPARDTEGREWLWQHYQVTLKFEQIFQEIINTGKMATQMQKERTLADKVLRAVGR